MGLWAADNEALQRADATHPLALMACADWAGEAADARRPLVSKAVFNRCVESRLRQHDTVRSCLRVASFFPGPVFAHPMPPPSAGLGADPQWALNAWYSPLGAVAWREYFRAYRAGLARIFKEAGQNLSVLSYPATAMASEAFVAPHYTHHDNWHVSRVYGKMVCNEVLERARLWGEVGKARSLSG